jgi:outer membrane protein
MRSYLVVVIAAIAVVLAAPAHAADLKIGVVNVARLVAEAPQAKKIQERLEQEFASQRREILAQQSDLQGLQERFQRDAQIMSESERANMERRIRDLGRDLQFRQQSYMEDVQTRRNEELGKLQRELSQAVEAFAKAEGYDLILTEGVAFRSDALDVTAQVLNRINR